MSDIIKVKVLADGTIKIETDAVSGANHINAEDLMEEIGKLAGGTVTREAKEGHHEHEHTHEDGTTHTHVGENGNHASKQQLDSFFAEWEKLTHANPICKFEAFFGRAAASLMRLSSGYVYVSRIRTLGLPRGQGYASLLLKLICELADRHGVPLELSVGPFGPKPRLGKRALRAWYQRHGFVRVEPFSDDMLREPQQRSFTRSQ